MKVVWDIGYFVISTSHIKLSLQNSRNGHCHDIERFRLSSVISTNASGLSHELTLSRRLVNNCPEASEVKQKLVIFFATTRNSFLSLRVVFDKLSV